jgi:hypothetical protein
MPRQKSEILRQQPRQKMIIRGHRDMLLLLPLGQELTKSPSRPRPSLEQAISSDTPAPRRGLFLPMYEIIHKTQFRSAFVLIGEKMLPCGRRRLYIPGQDWA